MAFIRIGLAWGVAILVGCQPRGDVEPAATGQGSVGATGASGTVGPGGAAGSGDAAGSTGISTAAGTSGASVSTAAATSGAGVGGATGTSSAGVGTAAGTSSAGAGGAGDGGTAGIVTVVTTQRIHQDWGVGSWSASTVQLTNVRAGDAILVLGEYWVSSGPGAAPSDSHGQLSAAVNQAPTYAHPPVVAQIYYELQAPAGTHVITPPDLGGGDGDGTLYVVQVRGLGTLVAVGDDHAEGTALPSVSTSLSSGARSGDFVVAIGGEDDAVAPTKASVSDPPAGWTSIGVQDDAPVNVPSEACYRMASSPGNQAVTWSWADTTANVTAAAIAAFR